MTPASYRAMILSKGGPLPWRARTGSGADQSPPTLAGEVEVATAAPAGAATLSLRAEYAVGRLVAGDVIAVGGRFYTVAAPTSAADGGLFAAVPIDPPLAGAVPAGAPVTLSFAADTVVTARVVEVTAKDLIGGVEAGDLRAVIAAQGCPIVPALGHEALVDGAPYRVVTVSRKTWGVILLGWEAQLRK
ncbi:hypothetical protein [Phaeospirillum tilakii]|uniref:Hint domain-containing protein n=1 Tax=Phaeospirillum tilakii TaxID=741673 RepID=A0ABW5CFD0_9PROT